MKYYEAAVIGGGILGCFAARNLRRWQISTVMIEQHEELCCEITAANAGIIYPGYDQAAGSLKAVMTVQANYRMTELSKELDVPFRRCGSLMVGTGKEAMHKLEQKYRQGIRNGLKNLQLLSGQEARAREYMLSEKVTAALFTPDTGTVNPWQLGIAAWENYRANGGETFMKTRVLHIRKEGTDYLLETTAGQIRTKTVLNCGGMSAAGLHEMIFPSSVRIREDGSDFLIFHRHVQAPEHVIFCEKEDGKKGITIVPTVEGTLLVSGAARPMVRPRATRKEGLVQITEELKEMFPALDLNGVIRSFAGVRPNPYRTGGPAGSSASIKDFCIVRPEAGFISLIGIKTPGLTCAQSIGMFLAREAAAYLNAEKNPGFSPVRRSIQAVKAQPGRIVCQCHQITDTQIREAISRGAVTLDGIKHRLSCGMGECQGSRCRRSIEQLLREEDYAGI